MVKYYEKNSKVKHEDIYHHDVLIFGGGPAGLTAAIYAVRYGLNTALLSKDIGGMANYAHKIENYPGYSGSGMELMQKFYKQAKDFGTRFLFEEVGKVDKDENGFVVETKNGKIVHAKSLIIASGTEKKKLNIPGEDKFLGKGVSYCATCDASFFKNKTVMVVGGSDSAAKAALLLSNIAKKVYISYGKEALRCEDIAKDKMGRYGKIETILNSIPVEIKGDKKAESIVLKISGEKKEVKVDGVFVEIGSVPLTGLVKNLDVRMTEDDYIIANQDMATNVPGVFAAGDAVKSKMKQILVAASYGAIAARSAYDWLKEK